MSKKPDASGEIVPDAEIDLRRTQLRNGHKLARMIAADRATLLPCPNPWCDGPAQPEPALFKNKYWRVMCGCGVASPRHGLKSRAIDLWNERPDPYDRVVGLVHELLDHGVMDLGVVGGLTIREKPDGSDPFNQLRREIAFLSGVKLPVTEDAGTGDSQDAASAKPLGSLQILPSDAQSVRPDGGEG